MSKLRYVTALILGTVAASGASAATVTSCSNFDINPTAQACIGFESGNLLNNAHINEQASTLGQLGLANWSGTALETISPLNGATSVNFSTVLRGISYIGIHFGNGQNGPGNGTAFYRFDAGAGLSSIGLNYAASSNAVLYSTNAVAAVPEPASWAMMIGGVGLAGGALRRRKSKVDARVSFA